MSNIYALIVAAPSTGNLRNTSNLEDIMPEPEVEKNRNTSDQVLADAEAAMRAHMAAAEARAIHEIEVLEQISKQLEAIEHLLRERLVKK